MDSAAVIWDIVKSIAAVSAFPVFTITWANYQKGKQKIETLQTELSDMKVENATVKEQLKNINDRLNEIKELVNILINKRR